MSRIGLIIGREFNQRVRKRSFIITTILTPLLMVGLMVSPALLMSIKSTDYKEILVVDESGFIAPELKNIGDLTLTQTDQTPEQLKESRQNVYGFLVIGEDVVTNPKNVQLYSYDASTVDIQKNITSQVSKIIETKRLLEYDIANLPEIMAQIKTNVSLQSFVIGDSGEQKESSGVLSMVASYIFGIMIYMFVFIYGGMVMQGVIEEKSSKVLEIMVSSVKPFELMMGKILGIAAVAITQFIIWIVLIFVLGSLAMQFFVGDMMAQGAAMAPAMGGVPQGMEGLDPEAIVAIKAITDIGFIAKMVAGFLIYFIGGYLLYAAMFAAIGSAVDNMQDAQQMQLPITIPLILAIFVTMQVMQDPNSNIAIWFSMIPLTSPIVMMARIPYGVPLWQLALSIGILYASFISMVWVSGKIYRVGIFMYGKKPGFKELCKWINYK